jgi:hypothetical protein
MPGEVQDTDVYEVVGHVEELESSRPLANLVVRAFDRDLLFDDKLGFAVTDAEGHFRIRFRAADFRDVGEADPDLYLRVYDSSGQRLLLDTQDRIRWNASPLQGFRLRVRRGALGGS